MSLVSKLKLRTPAGIILNVATVFVLAGTLGTRAQVSHGRQEWGTSTTTERPSARPTGTETGTSLRIGDRLKIAFYEMIDVPGAGAPAERGPAGAQAPLLTFFQRMDLSGDYAIDGDGAIAIPRLGRFEVEGRRSKDLQSELSAAFARAMARPADVNVTVVERSPIYVVGPVKNAGAYKHVPGMMVLHAVALSGGLDQERGSTSQLIEGVREMERLRKAADQMNRLIARRARLEMESTGGTPVISPELVALTSEKGAKAILAGEIANLQVEKSRRQQQHKEAEATTQGVRNEIQALKRQLAQLDVHAQIRNERLADLQGLLARGLTTRNSLIVVRGELADIEARQQQIQLSMVQADGRLVQADQAKARLDSDNQASLTRSIAATDSEMAELQQSLTSAETVSALIEDSNARILQSRSGATLAYEIVRQGQTGPVVLSAQETSSLLPGDVLKILFAPPMGSEAATSPLRKASLQAARPAMR